MELGKPELYLIIKSKHFCKEMYSNAGRRMFKKRRLGRNSRDREFKGKTLKRICPILKSGRLEQGALNQYIFKKIPYNNVVWG